MDLFLENLPITGRFFEKTYAFWRENIAVANLTHIILGLGLGLLFSRYRKFGIVFIVTVIIIHLVALLA